MFDWSPCLSMIAQAEKIVVLPHISADGDALGASFALALALTAQGKAVSVVLEEVPENRLAFMLPSFGPQTEIFPVREERNCDMAIAVDCADRLRLGKRADLFFQAPRQVKIDHHVEKDPFGQINYVNQDWAAVCEGIWELLCQRPFLLESHLRDTGERKSELYRALALCLYCGVASDTGSFAYSNTTENTHKIAGALVDFLGDISEIHFRLFDSSSRAAIALRAAAYGKLHYEAKGKAVFLELKQEDFEAAGAVYADANDLVSVLRGIENVELAVFARPNRDGKGMKVSLRSNRFCDVAALAASFGGGGHKRAAGFDFSGPFMQVKEQILKYMEAGSDGFCGCDY